MTKIDQKLMYCRWYYKNKQNVFDKEYIIIFDEKRDSIIFNCQCCEFFLLKFIFEFKSLSKFFVINFTFFFIILFLLCFLFMIVLFSIKWYNIDLFIIERLINIWSRKTMLKLKKFNKSRYCNVLHIIFLRDFIANANIIFFE